MVRGKDRLFAPRALGCAVAAVFEAAGCVLGEAATIAKHLLGANLTGHDSHGVIRVHQYLGYIREGTVRPGQHATLVRETANLAVVDGNLGFGQVVGEEAMALLAKKAKHAGLAMIALRNSGHLGRIGGWAELLAEADLVSLHFVNTSGFGMYVVPFGGSDRRLSLNPVAIGVPVTGRETVLLDFTTAMCARGKVAVARNKGERMPPGYILDRYGQPTDDPNEVYEGGAVLPFGGYKGYGLNVIADLLAGGLSGGGCTRDGTSILINNMTSVAIDPGVFADLEAYAAEIRRYGDWVKASPPRTSADEVLLPGEPEHRARETRSRDGIPIDETTWSQLLAAAESVGLESAEVERLATGAGALRTA